MSVVSNPTYMDNIRHFFTEGDIACMKGQGINMATYAGVRANALRIYFRVEEKSMPPGNPWPDDQVQTFYNWMKNGYPRGNALPTPPDSDDVDVAQDDAHRVRKNITDLDDDEIKVLKKAFEGMMAKDMDDPTSYFAVAGVHWLPGKKPGPQYFCRHHENAFQPWHRLYMLQFEDALRTIPGCENVTIPYWDITDKEVPAVLYEAPFDKYTLPTKICNLDNQCYSGDTQRYDATEVAKNIHERYGIPEIIDDAMGQSHWEVFDGWDGGLTQAGITRAHDTGHVSTGPTMAVQDWASFDPIFWFFHCNWDRLWWQWQQSFGATTVATFKTHIQGEDNWLEDPVLNGLPPYTDNVRDTIDLTSFNVAYQHPGSSVVTASPVRMGSAGSAQSFALHSSTKASVRVKGVDRLQIPGSFEVGLYSDDNLIAAQGFFQSTTPKHCGSCKKKAIVNFDFLVDVDELTKGKVSVKINAFRPNGKQIPYPLANCGNPTINARLLLE